MPIKILIINSLADKNSLLTAVFKELEQKKISFRLWSSKMALINQFEQGADLLDGVDAARIVARGHRFDRTDARSGQQGKSGSGAADIGKKTIAHDAALVASERIKAAYQRAEALGIRRWVA